MLHEYKAARRAIKLKRNDSKGRCWRALLKDVVNDVWGRPYKIVTKKLRRLFSRAPSDQKEFRRIVTGLFPERDVIDFLEVEEVVDGSKFHLMS